MATAIGAAKKRTLLVGNFAGTGTNLSLFSLRAFIYRIQFTSRNGRAIKGMILIGRRGG
jgi:hypothetical protein